MEILMTSLADIEVIILAGGRGTRLRTVVADLPKPMADISGQPFISCLLQHLAGAGFRRAVLSVGYKHEDIEQFLGNRHASMDISYVVEQQPLGTGGGILKALRAARTERVFILNGDTFFAADLAQMLAFHLEKQARLTMALRPMADCSRYGTVTCEDGFVTRFAEKRSGTEAGLINGGIYLADRKWLTGMMEQLRPADTFSFENDILTALPAHTIAGRPDDGFFIDIGIPEDYMKACRLLPALLSPTENA